VATAPEVDVGEVNDPTAVPPVQGVPTVVSLQAEKVTVPVGALPVTPVRVAESDVDDPRTIPFGAAGVVMKPGVALVTVKHSREVDPSEEDE
jgi:hypothetical protein